MNNSRKNYITVRIEELTMKALLSDRFTYWLPNPEDKDMLRIYQEFTDFLVDAGYFDGADFDPVLIVDNLYINDTSFYDSVDDALRDGYEEGDIAYLDEDTGCVLIWAC